ncbi:MAG TPA: S49 family peptidase [Gemmatimonadaceae bacterium]|jgi:signal peptide peptidase SppA|nr:S49 family peptidase [Gemmatimonadaceae bacterium]
MGDRYAHILSFALSHPWAIDEDMMPVIAGALARHIAGVSSSAEIQAALVDRKNLPQPRAGSIAIIPVYGVIAPRMNMMSDMSGGTTFEQLTNQLRAAVADKTVKTIVLDVNSPGGSVAGSPEFAAEVMKARAKKPIIAQAQYTMASAAYQLAAACTEIVASPSARVGSVGVFSMHNDLSAALEKLGVKRKYYSAGIGKVDGNETGPPSEEYDARTQASVEAAYSAFVSSVVKGRGQGMTADRVRTDWKAHVYDAPAALANGMIDSIATLDETITRLLTASPDAADRRAALAFASVDATDQELPRAATSQERQAEITWQHALDRQLLELDL